MTKPKTSFITVLTIVFVLVLAAPAMAVDWVHGNYSATTDACAGCHVAHAAPTPKLLKAGEGGTTQAHFCFMCHGEGTMGAPYDIQMGRTFTVGADPDGTFVLSTAGGFEKLGGPGGNAVTSRHKVWGYATNAAALSDADAGGRGKALIPGGTKLFHEDTKGLVCGSCHDPHAGGALTFDGDGINTGTQNPRLLRKSFRFADGTVTVGSTVRFKMTNIVNATFNTRVYQVTEYVSGSTDWCGACHDKFKTSAGSGQTADAFGMYRHAMDVAATLPGHATGGLIDGTPLETGADKVACLTCHRAHATTATATGARSSTWPGEGTQAGSALLRMNERGVCYNCHGAAAYNKPS